MEWWVADGRIEERVALPSRDFWVKLYLALLVFTLPMDNFNPTRILFREGGTRPAIPLMIAGSVHLLIHRRRWFLNHLPRSSFRVLTWFAIILACGLLAFTLNLIFGWSSFSSAKNPIFQFATQALLFVIVAPILIAHAALFEEQRWREQVMAVLPWAALIHLIAIGMDAAGILRSDAFPLSLFRTGDLLTSMRTAGLVSEPSYAGTMAAMYGLPLIFAGPKDRRGRYAILALVFFVTAFVIKGKTVIPTALIGCCGYLYQSRTRIFTLPRILLATAVLGVAAVAIVFNSALDVSNLSTAMRFGSTLVAWNVAIAGYGLLGIGFGQFHFLFQPRFAPAFLFYSTEAIAQMSSQAEFRASTFNLFARLLVETGIVGLGFFVAFSCWIFRMARNDNRRGSLLGTLFFATAIGFLITQDPYCFPPLIFGAALVLGAHESDRKNGEATVS